MHRFGQQVRREVLRPQQLDHAHGTTGEEREERHLQLLREKLEGISGGEIRGLVEERGVDRTVRELVDLGEGLKVKSHGVGCDEAEDQAKGAASAIDDTGDEDDAIGCGPAPSR